MRPEADRPTLREAEDQEFQEHKREAFDLGLQEKHGKVTPEGRERLGVLRAKMDGLLVQRVERAKRRPTTLEALYGKPEAEPGAESAQRKSVGHEGSCGCPLCARAEVSPAPAADLQAQPEAGEAERGEGDLGIPVVLRAGIESLSGQDLSGVRVHSNSPKPAQIGALAFAQRDEIHLGQGQEENLPHEAWHVAQQRQGRVAPTEVTRGLPLNADPDLEREADVMGERVLRRKSVPPKEELEEAKELVQRKVAAGSNLPDALSFQCQTPDPSGEPIQAVFAGSNLIDSDAFQALTPRTLKQLRRATVDAIDGALDLYHASNQGNALANLDNLIATINHYLVSKLGDPTNPRIVPVRNLRQAAVLERANVFRLDQLHQQGVAADLTTIGQVAGLTLAEMNALAVLVQVNAVAQIAQLHALVRADAEIVQLAALNQVASFLQLSQLAALARPTAEILSLAGLGGAGLGGRVLAAAPTFAELVQLEGNARSIADFTTLMALPQINTVAQLLQAAGFVRALADVTTLSGLGGAGLSGRVLAAAPTFAELVQLEGNARSIADFTTLMALPQINTVAELVQATGFTRALADVTALGGLGGAGLGGKVLAAAPSFAQLVQLEGTARSIAEYTQLIAPGQVNTVADLLDLALSTRPVAEVLTLAAAAAPAAATGPVNRAATVLAQIPPSPFSVAQGTGPDDYGWTFPESVQLTITAYPAGGTWYGAVTNLTGNYSQQVRLLPGQVEVTGPGGNSNAGNYAAQVQELRALGNPGATATWYMLQAVQDHEDVHLTRFLPALNDVEPAIQALFLARSVPASLLVNNTAAAVVALQNLGGHAAVVAQAYTLWLNRAAALIAGDHNAGGPTDTAEHAVVDPMITTINNAAVATGWGPAV